MTVFSEANNIGDLLKYEADNLYSREEITVLAGSGATRPLAVGQILGCRTKSSAVGAKVSGDGNGTIGTVTLGAKAEVGVYTLTCTAASTNAGTFMVTSPSGMVLKDLTVAAAYTSEHINLTVADGSTDWGVGAIITVTVSGDGKYVAVAPAAVDGTQDAEGVLLYAVTAPDGSDIKGVAVVRHAVINEDYITYTAGMTTPQKAAALAQLKKIGILTRKGA